SEDIREALENLNLGRLRIASKGITRDPKAKGEKSGFVTLSSEEQKAEGMYMIGQLAALRDSVCTIRDLHEEGSTGGARLLKDLELPEDTRISSAAAPAPKPADIAIVGMGCLLPGAKNVKVFWKNVLDKVDSVREIPVERFDYNLYLDNDK